MVPLASTPTTTMRPCLTCGTPTPNTRCPNCEHTKQRQRNAARGDRYGAQHRATRKAWAPHIATGTILCARCHRPIHPNHPWHLDHLDHGTAPSHAHCNVVEGGRRGGHGRDG
jgi:hypothetical protein